MLSEFRNKSAFVKNERWLLFFLALQCGISLAWCLDWFLHNFISSIIVCSSYDWPTDFVAKTCEKRNGRSRMSNKSATLIVFYFSREVAVGYDQTNQRAFFGHLGARRNPADLWVYVSGKKDTGFRDNHEINVYVHWYNHTSESMHYLPCHGIHYWCKL